MSKKHKRDKPANQASVVAQKTTYIVYVYDRLARWGEDSSYKAGEFETHEEAVEKAKETIRSSMESAYKVGMTHQQLLKEYNMWGDDPSIVPGLYGHGQINFSSSNYASSYADELLSRKAQATDPKTAAAFQKDNKS